MSLPFSSELAMCDFCLLLKVKMITKDKYFELIQDIEVTMTMQLKKLIDTMEKKGDLFPVHPRTPNAS